MKKVDKYIIHLDEPLGEGSYASVFIGHHSETSEEFAIKIIEKIRCIFVRI